MTDLQERRRRSSSPQGSLDLAKLRETILPHVARYIDDPDDAEDVAQRCLLKAWRNLEAIRDPKCLGGWLRTLAKNEALSWLRAEKARRKKVRHFGTLVVQESAWDPSRRLIARIGVGRFLETLDCVDRQLVLLRYWGGLSSPEAGDLLGLAPSSARCRIMRLRTRLEETGHGLAP